MQILRYHDPELFKIEVNDFLLKHEAENNLPLGILANLIAGEYSDQPPYLSQAMENDITRLVVMRTPPFPALFSYDLESLNDEILHLVVNDLWKEFGSELTGITAEKALAARLVDSWQRISGKKQALKMAMRIYKLEQVLPVSNVAGMQRLADKDDAPLILEWYADFIREAMREEPELEVVNKSAERYLQAEPSQRGLMFWEVGGEPVSMAGYAGPTTNGIRIGAVYTPPAQRKKGYASACTAGLSQYLLELGFQFCFLFTDLLNPISNHIYQQIGFEPVCDVDTYDFI